MPTLSAVIPTRNRPDALAECLRLLAAQTIGPQSLEILVGYDGKQEKPLSEKQIRTLAGDVPLIVIECPRSGIAEVKNRLIAAATGDIVLFLNDDVQPAPDLAERHVRAHAEERKPAMILGDSPWVVPEDETCFDRLIAGTSMVFFYDQMRECSDRAKDWGFRHAWNLNLSAPRSELLAVGGFRPAIANCCYEDVEIAHRLAKERGIPVLFRPEAVAVHDHRYEPETYLEREHRLGYSAFGFAHAAPECAGEIFGCDLRAKEALEYAEAFVRYESRGERAMLEEFERLAERPADDSINIALAYGQHVILKRLAFRRGLLAASRGERLDGLFHPSDGLETGPGLGQK